MAILKSKENAFTPLFIQVEVSLQELIKGVKYAPGDQIPSERALSEIFGISRMTARREIEDLIKLGLLERRFTQGNFVRKPKMLRMVNKDFSLGLTQMLQSAGAQPESLLLKFEIIPSTQKISENINLWAGEMVMIVRRLRLVNDAPFCIETSYLPQSIVPGLSADDFALENSSLYAILRERYDIIPTNNDETLKISYATSDEADLLGLKRGSPILLMRSVVMHQQGRRIEYLKSVNHPERVIFHSTTKVMSL